MIKIPTQKTLDKYGLSEEEWLEILHRQGDVCAICGIQPSTGRFYTDHEHVKGWKHMPPEERKKYVRGLLCYIDNNKILTRGVNIERLRKAANYLEAYDTKKLVQDQKLDT